MILFLQRLSWILLLPARVAVYPVLLLVLGLAWLVDLNTGIEYGLDFSDLVPAFPGSRWESFVLVDEYDYHGSVFESLAQEAREQLEDTAFDLDAYIRERFATRLKEAAENEIETAGCVLPTDQSQEYFIGCLDGVWVNENSTPAWLSLAEFLDNNDADIIAAYTSIYGTPEALAEDKNMLAECELGYDASAWGHHDQAVKNVADYVKPLGTETMHINGLDVEIGVTLKNGFYEVRGIEYPDNLYGQGSSLAIAKYDFKTSFQAKYPAPLICDEEIAPSPKVTGKKKKAKKAVSKKPRNQEID